MKRLYKCPYSNTPPPLPSKVPGSTPAMAFYIYIAQHLGFWKLFRCNNFNQNDRGIVPITSLIRNLSTYQNCRNLSTYQNCG